MTDSVIVALPEENDYVNRISSQKKPHLTLMYLGDSLDMARLPQVVQYIQHLTKTSMCRFGLSVDRRGTLGDQDADVLFFEDGWQTKEIRQIQEWLRGDEVIANAYAQSKQFAKWTPHLTLGYPGSPANEDTRDYPGINYVHFDRIAIWTGDSEGPEFRLKSYEGFELAMSALGESFAEYFMDETILEHYGVKGMRWGHRTKNPGPVAVTLKTSPGRRVKAKGGEKVEPSEDAKLVAEKKQIAKKSSTDALSNAELKKVVERMQLEANYDRLATQSAGASIVKKILFNQDHRNKSVSNVKNLADLGSAGYNAVAPGSSIRDTDLTKIGR